MKLLKFVVKKSLLALGYPRLETIHPELGVYEVGALRERMSPTVPACQFFYPVDTTSSSNRKSKRKRKRTSRRETYYRKEAVDGLLDFLGGFGDGLLQMLQEKPHPCHYGMNPLGYSATEGKAEMVPDSYPLVIFSHGLSGTMEMYTQLCSQIASTGCVVVAVEHEDGSASYAESLVDGSEDVLAVPYQRPATNFTEVPYTRQWELDFRAPMLEQRVEELETICKVLEQPECGDSQLQNPLLQKIVSVADTSRLHLVGHSFGGATQLLAAQRWEKKQQQAAVPEMALSAVSSATSTDHVVCTKREATIPFSPKVSPLSITVFDAWNFALPDEVLSTGLGNKQPTSLQDPPTPPIEILSVLSETWATKGPERGKTLEFLDNCDPSRTNVRSYFCKDSVHQSVSDTEAFVPSFAAQKIGNRGKGEPRHRTIRAIVEEIAKLASANANEPERQEQQQQQQQQQAGTPDEDTALVPFPLQ